MFKKIATTTTALSALVLTGYANAAIDYSSITSGINFEAAGTAVVGVAAAIGVVYIAIAGSRAVLRMLKTA